MKKLMRITQHGLTYFEVIEYSNLAVNQHNELVDENEKLQAELKSLKEDFNGLNLATDRMKGQRGSWYNTCNEISNLKLPTRSYQEVVEQRDTAITENEKLQAGISHLRAKNKELEEQYNNSRVELIKAFQRPATNLEVAQDMLKSLYEQKVIVKAIQIEDNGAVITIEV